MLHSDNSISCKTLGTTLQEAYKNLARAFQGRWQSCKKEKNLQEKFPRFLQVYPSCNILHILQDFMAILQDDFYWVYKNWHLC